MSTGYHIAYRSVDWPSDTTRYSSEFGVGMGAHLVVDTFVDATGTPTITWTLERYEQDGTWDTYDTGTEAFTADDGVGGINIKNPKPGQYRLLMTNGGGGSSTAGTAKIVAYLGTAA